MGAGNLNHRELHQLIKMRTGGMSLSTHVTTDHSDMYAFEQVTVGWEGGNDNHSSCLKPSKMILLFSM